MTDCLILGGGVIGLSLAYDLARHGAEVTVLDRGELGRQSSWAGAGILPAARFAAARDGFEQLAGLAGELHPRWAAELREATGIDNGYRRSGGIYLARSEEDAATLGALAADWRRQEIDCRELSLAALAEMEPALAIAGGSLHSAWHVPDESQLRNPRHIQALVAACEQLGVRLKPRVECIDIELAAGRATGVVTNEGVLPAGAICVTAGAWSGELLSHVGVRLRVKPIRGQIVLLQTPGRILTAVVNDARRYLVPRDDGRVLVGSTEEDAGFDASTTPEGIAGLLQFAAELSPALAAATVERTWAGLRPASADGQPYLGRATGFENLYYAAGHHRAGLFLSPATAVVMSRLIRGKSVGIEIDDLRKERDDADRED